jgi:hypothetical protein
MAPPPIGLHALYKNISKVIGGKKDPIIYALAAG